MNWTLRSCARGKPRVGTARFAVAAGAILLATASCGVERPPSAQRAERGVTVLTAWAHAGREDERATLTQQLKRFNETRPGIRIDLTFLPEGSYDSQVQAASLAGELPDLLEFDGPFVYNYAWQNKLVPIDTLLSESVRENLIPSILAQGRYRGRLYTVGQFDSGLGMYGRRSMLEAVGARLPAHPREAWSAAEFDAILERLAARDPDGQVLDLKLSYRGEWFTYAFSPAIQSAGGDLIDPADFSTSRGFLDGPEACGAMRWFRRWIHERRRVDPNLDDYAFLGGRVALSWVGHWEYRRYREAWGDDLVLLPLPDFGKGMRTGQGSWNWGVTSRCADPKGAVRFLEFLLEDENVLAMTRLNAAVPATRTAVERSELHGPGGPLRLFVEQLTGGYAVPRPRTPAYPVITYVFQKVFDDVRHGADVARALDWAVVEIDRDLRDNRGYPQVD